MSSLGSVNGNLVYSSFLSFLIEMKAAVGAVGMWESGASCRISKPGGKSGETRCLSFPRFPGGVISSRAFYLDILGA
jgi:hypothetical protein